MRRNVSVLGISTLVALILGEMLVRLAVGFPLVPLVPPPVPPAPRIRVIASETRVYRLPPLDVTAGTNAAGLRGAERAVAKPPGTFRILALGDSVTYGYRVPPEDAFVTRLERLLDAQAPAGTRIEVLNFGVPGYNTVQELAYLQEEGLAYTPDLVLLTYVLNDADEAITPDTWLGRASDAANPPPLLAQTVGRFRLPQFFYGAYGQLRGATGLAGEPADATFTEDNPGWLASRDALREMAALTAARGVPLVVSIFPILARLDERYPHRGAHERIARTAAAAGAHPLDLLPAYTGQPARSLWVGPADHHPNARGHQIAAEALHQFLLSRRLVPTGG